MGRERITAQGQRAQDRRRLALRDLQGEEGKANTTEVGKQRQQAGGLTVGKLSSLKRPRV